jgi:hypothetical protein
MERETRFELGTACLEGSFAPMSLSLTILDGLTL